MSHKYGAKPTEVDGVRFASRAEANRYGELKLMEYAGEIRELELQPTFEIVVNGMKICRYIADFRYIDVETGETVIEDVKGMKTQVYKLKKKLVRAVHGVEITEVAA